LYDPRAIFMNKEKIQEFMSGLKGEVILPDDVRYASSRKVWNGMIDKHPSMIVYCLNTDDVIRSVKFARENKLLVAVRSGGHNVAGNAVCDDGMVIDLSHIKQIKVDATSRTVRAGAGLTLGELDTGVQAFGLAVPVGIVSRTGIAGLTLGGGIGWLMRRYGLTCDNLVSVEIVTADGRLLTADVDENADLFWGLRGGGGNFGIVTAFTYRLFPVNRVLSGMVCYPFERAGEILAIYQEFISNAPDELSTMAAFFHSSQSPVLHVNIPGTFVIAIHVCYSGPLHEGEEILNPLRENRPLIMDTIMERPYLEMQSMFDTASPSGQLNYWKSTYLNKLSPQAIDVIVSYAEKVPSLLSQIHVQHLEGAVSRIDEKETAFSYRDAKYVLNIVSRWMEQVESEDNIRWTREFAAAMEPYSMGGAYVNFMGEEGETTVKSSYSSSDYNRLVRLKNKYDPHNFFRLNQNIKPSSVKSEQ
jgi:FAD/FMN-containing dehydrogenase